MKKQLIAAIAALAMTVTSMPMISYAADETPEPILRYTFDETNALADENGKNELTLSGGAIITEEGNKGSALLLDGVDGYALLPSDIVSDSMTITAWVKINKFTTWGRVFDFGTDSNNNFFFAPYSGGASRTELKTPSGVDTMDADQETERDWVHYAVTVSDGTISYYRNGRLIKSKSGVTQSLSDLKDELNYIGKSHYDGDAYLAAAVDDFRVYDTALDRDEICSVMADGEINPEIMLKSYAIEDEQIITGDKIDLPTADGISWSETDDLGLIDTKTGAVKHNEQTEKVTLVQSFGDYTVEYTAYVTGTAENPYTINIDAADRSKDVSDNMWGLFFEDINSAADGGLYAELVQNRSFEMDDHLYSWETEGDVTVNIENPICENNPTYVTLGAGASIINDGFQGISVKAGEKYDFSVYTDNGSFSFGVQLLDEDGNIIADQGLGQVTDYASSQDEPAKTWKKQTFTLEPTADTSNATLVLSNDSNGTLDIDMVSLIPEDTYKGHGLRKDLMEALEAMHPKFLRFPGGCAIEGRTMDEAWNWKDTIGDVSERKEMMNIWNPSATEPYMMTYGLGFYEYFQMCEDLDMEPVPILNCGIACQVRSGSAEDEEHLVPMDELQPYIDDALDLIAFANGTDESNEWVQKRIEMGHKEPFNLKYIGIGNEQYGEIYFERYAEFAKQIHEKYPDINLVTTSGTASSGTSNDLAWNWANENTELADRMDEHYYETADWFRQHAYRYDNYRRDTNTKVFLGEYASKGNTWYNALSEAAFMTGLERNADVVRMASYAPMFAKYGNTQWSAANMIWFNNDEYVLTPNYYVQQLFSLNQGDYSLPTEVTMNGIETDNSLHGGIAVGSWGTNNDFKDIQVYDNDRSESMSAGAATEDANIIYSGFGDEWQAGNGEWTLNEDGSVSQTSDLTGSLYYISPDNLDIRNYTLTLKARKNSGGEGFQIGVAVDDSDNYYRVNIGGWGNTTAKVQQIVNGVSSSAANVAEQAYVGDVHINDGEWYDVKVDVTNDTISAYLNDELVCSYIVPKSYGPVYASSVYDEESGDVIVKLVNTLDSDVNVGINTNGADVDSTAYTITMSGDPNLENTLENKGAITPGQGELENVSNSFTYNAPANSFSVIKLSTSNAAEGETHKAYISGYPDGTFRADNTITRAEAATIIAKLGGIDENEEYESNFSDVSSDAWYKNYVGFASEIGCINGYEDGTFKADRLITRAEFAAIVGKYIGFDGAIGEASFNDVDETHWAKGYINQMSGAGIIKGYSDGTFKPNNTITRAEAVTMINRAFGRADNAATLENPFSDISEKHWAYNEVIEAAVTH
jgi:alpha-L-arabinofuranosidase